jgi:hypothetical protein
VISVSSQIQSLLDLFGIHLDQESFENLLAHLRVNRLSWQLKTALAVALSVLVQYLRQQAKERAKAAEEALKAPSEVF